MSDRLRELLVKAVRELSPEEQDEILGALLVSQAGPARLIGRHQIGLGHLGDAVRAQLGERLSTMVGDSGDLKVLPVRLPVTDYERLRAWAGEHQFSMAVIVRTLVERFLDGQAVPRPGGGAPSGTAGA